MTYYLKYCDEVRRVIQAVLIDSRAYGNQNGNLYRKSIDDYIKSLGKDTVVYKIEDTKGVLAGFAVVRPDQLTFDYGLRRAFLPHKDIINKAIDNYVIAKEFQFDYLETTFGRSLEYGFTEYNPANYTTQGFSFVKLDYDSRVYRAVLIDAKSNFISVNVNGNVINQEIERFVITTLRRYQALYKIENKQGVLVGIMGVDPCIEAPLLILRRPFQRFVEQIRAAAVLFKDSTVWYFDMLELKPCPPEDVCYLAINTCYATINGCRIKVFPKRPFEKRFFTING